MSIVMLLIVLSTGVVQATTSEFRSPLSILRGPYHYPLAPVADDIWSMKIERIGECESLWIIDSWAVGYGRKADRSYIDCCGCDANCGWNECLGSTCSTNVSCCGTQVGCCDECNCPSTKNTTNTVPLSTLFFGKSDFRGEEAFANGLLIGGCDDAPPALRYAKLSPRFDYNEHGAVLGVHAQRKLKEDSPWHFGARASLPIKVIEVEQRRSCGSERFEEGFGDVVVEYQQQYTDGKANTHLVKAYRLDFLSALNWIDGTSLVSYGDGAQDTTIAEIPVTSYATRVSPVTIESSVAPVSALRRNDGKLPSPPNKGLQDQDSYGSQETYYPLARPVKAGDLPEIPLNAAGTNGTDAQRLQFKTATNYASGLASNRDAQAKLFIVSNTLTAGNGLLDEDGLLIQNKIDYLLNQLALNERNSTEQFFKDHGICFCLSDYVAGIGDLDTEIYFGYEHECGYLDGIFGLRLPTGKKPCDPNRIYYQALGNKGHFEVKGALEGGWHPFDWFAIRAYASYSAVIEANECRAPAFKCACIKNIPVGCPVEAKVKWDYFLGNIDFTWFHPDNPNLGCSLGYELYAKRNDQVTFCTPSVVDFCGARHDLDHCILECNTDTMTHKVRGEIFDRIGYCEFYGGGSWIFAGRNAMKETELHIGVVVYF